MKTSNHTLLNNNSDVNNNFLGVKDFIIQRY